MDHKTKVTNRTVANTFVRMSHLRTFRKNYCQYFCLENISFTHKHSTMISTNPYFNFLGNAEEAMNFYKTIFGGEFTGFQRFNDMPGCEKMPTEEQSKMMHIALTTPKGHMFMATDALESMDHKLSFGNNSYTMLNTESEAETERLYNGLSAGG